MSTGRGTRMNTTTQPNTEIETVAGHTREVTGFGDRYGSWAVVTGASSGLGEEFARQLAAEGLNLVLIARRVERLEALANELTYEHGVGVKTLAVDLTDPEATSEIEAATWGLDVGLLVNNAGAESHGAFLNQMAIEAERIIELNVLAPMHLAHLFGRKLARRGRGGIIFVASTLGYQAVPFFANYAATKAYIVNLAEALSFELKEKGIDVTVLSPGLTNTAMKEGIESSGVDFAKAGVTAMDVSPVVAAAIRSLGHRPAVIPGVMNNVLTFLSKRVMSRSAGTTVFGSLMSRAIPADLR
jgi:uncharacterized protein